MSEFKVSADVIPQEEDNTELKKSQEGRKRNPRSRTLAFLLYPDNPEHAVVFSKVISRYDYAYILHDKDEREMDFNEHCLDEDDEMDRELIKKAHYHILTFHPSEKSSVQLAKELGLDSRFVRPVSSRTSMCLYLTHIGDRAKHQYSHKDIVSNRPSIYYEAINSYLTDTEKLEKMISIIQNKNCLDVTFAMRMLSYYGLTKFALKNLGAVREFVNDNLNVERVSSMGFLAQLKNKEKLEQHDIHIDLQEVFK